MQHYHDQFFFQHCVCTNLWKGQTSENMGHFHAYYNFWLLDKRWKFDMLVFFTYLSLTEFQVWYLTLFLLFSVIGSFGWFLMGNLPKNIQLMIIITICHSVCLKAKIIWLWKLSKLSLSIISYDFDLCHFI